MGLRLYFKLLDLIFYDIHISLELKMRAFILRRRISSSFSTDHPPAYPNLAGSYAWYNVPSSAAALSLSWAFRQINMLALVIIIQKSGGNKSVFRHYVQRNQMRLFTLRIWSKWELYRKWLTQYSPLKWVGSNGSTVPLMSESSHLFLAFEQTPKFHSGKEGRVGEWRWRIIRWNLSTNWRMQLITDILEG